MEGMDAEIFHTFSGSLRLTSLQCTWLLPLHQVQMILYAFLSHFDLIWLRVTCLKLAQKEKHTVRLKKKPVKTTKEAKKK